MCDEYGFYPVYKTDYGHLPGSVQNRRRRNPPVPAVSDERVRAILILPSSPLRQCLNAWSKTLQTKQLFADILIFGRLAV
jgi:hypothetical protein